MSTPAISVRDLTKSYDGRAVVDSISFDVEEGSFFALLGPNGAGKSTTISAICSLIDPDSGSVSIFGKDAAERGSLMDIGVVFQASMLDDRLTVRENIEVRGSMYGLSGKDLDEAVDRVLKDVNAESFADLRYKKLSGGQRRRADIARALVHSPRLLILDEPTSGLDPQSRHRIWETVLKLNKEDGLTVLLTTHYMEEAEEADDILIVEGGRIAARGTPVELRESYCRDVLILHPADEGAVIAALDSVGIAYTTDAGIVRVELGSTLDSVDILERLRGTLVSFEVRMGTLDEAFLGIIGRDEERIR